VNRFLEIRHANFYRGPALGGIDRGNLDPDDSEVVELHRSSLFYRDRYLGVGANMTVWLRKRRLAKVTFAERGTCLCCIGL
jgi:hypothetical protein